MKKILISITFICAMTLTSCYTLEYSVGNGAQGKNEVKGKNHYVIEGLVALKTTAPTQLAGGAKDYDVKITHSFVDGLLFAITGGLYSPTTTIVTK